MVEQLGYYLPEVGRQAAFVLFYYSVGAHSALSVHQAHKDHSLGDGHVLYIVGEEAQKLFFDAFDILCALGAFGDVCSYRAVYLRYQFAANECVGIYLVEVIYQAEFFAPVAAFEAFAAGEYPYRLQCVEESGVAAFHLVVHRVPLRCRDGLCAGRQRI